MTDDPVAKKISRSPDFKVIAPDTFGLTLNDNLLNLRLGLQIVEPERETLELGIITMTPRSAKILSIVLSNALSAYEEKVGKIKIPDGREAKIKAEMKIGGKLVGQPPDTQKG